MAQARVIIEISASRVEVSLIGPAGAARTERFGRSEWPTPFTAALPDLQMPLTRMLGELGVTKGTARVIYTTPGAVTSVSSCPATGVVLAEAEEAALLSLANVADFPIDGAATDTSVLLVDAPGSAKPQRHILACAEAQQRAEALAGLVRACGLEVDALIPGEAVAISDGAQLVTTKDQQDADRVRAVVWVGEHFCALVVGGVGRLLLTRTIGVGLEAMVEALGRPLRPRDPELPPVSLAHGPARDLLYRLGVPAADAPVPDHPTLAGSSVLPHLQPVVQRLSVEIKQSLRFGLSEADRARVRLVVAGPGSAVPGLASTLARMSGFESEPEQAAAGREAPDSSELGLIAALARTSTFSVALLPEDARARRAGRKVRHMLAAGAALAMLYVGAEAFDARGQLTKERDRLQQIKSAASTAQGPAALRESLISARQALSGVETRMRTTLGDTPDLAAALELMAISVPDGVRLQLMDYSSNEGGKLSMRGLVKLGPGVDAPMTIRSFVDVLTKAPIVEQVRLGATQRSITPIGPVQNFELVASLVSVPPVHAVSSIAAPATKPTAPVASAEAHP